MPTGTPFSTALADNLSYKALMECLSLLILNHNSKNCYYRFLMERIVYMRFDFKTTDHFTNVAGSIMLPGVDPD